MRYVPLKTFLYSLSLSVPPEEWNTSSAMQWGITAARRIGGLSLFSTKVEYYQVENHVLEKPESFRTLNQFEVYWPSLSNSSTDNTVLLDKIQRRVDSPHPELFINGEYGFTDLNTSMSTTNKKALWRVLYKSNGHLINTCDTHNIKNCVPQYLEDMNNFKFSFKFNIYIPSFF